MASRRFPDQFSRFRRSRAKSWVGRSLVILALGLPISAIAAASIVINTNGSIEFGQGSAEVVTCDDQINLDPVPIFNGEAFELSAVTASNIDDTACANRNLVVSVYSTDGALLIKETLRVTASSMNFDLSSASPAITTNQVGAITAEFFSASSTPSPTPTATFVTNNLQLRLDASDSSSYPGTGTTWFDISGNSHDATIVNNPSFTSDDGGAFVLTGTSNYISLGNVSALKPTSEITLSQWLNATDWAFDSGSDYRSGLSSTQGGGYAIYLLRGKLVAYIHSNSTYQRPQIVSNTLSGWHYVSVTFDGRYARLYVDGVERNVVDAGGTFPIFYNATNSIMIGAEASGTDVPESGRRWEGEIATTEIYNRALSAAEVLENYNATKSRFGK